MEKKIHAVVTKILEDYKKERSIDKLDLANQPQKEGIIQLLHKIIRLVYPGYFRDSGYKVYNLDNDYAVQIDDAIFHMNKQVNRALRYHAQYRDLDDGELEKISQKLTISPKNVYVIKAGDTLSDISKKYGVPVEQIKEL